MKNLPKVTPTDINGSDTNSVNARELYAHLDLAQGQFQRWINKNLVKNDFFTEDKDYIGVRLIVEGNDVADYIITLDVAKHLSMMAKTKEAHKIRDYFINIEKKSKAVALPKNALKEIKLALAGVVELDERLDVHNDRIEVLERTKRLENWQEKSLMDAHHRKVYEIAALYKSDREDKKLISSLHRKIWQVFKRHFKLTRYNELKAIDFEDGMTFINNLSIGDMV